MVDEKQALAEIARVRAEFIRVNGSDAGESEVEAANEAVDATYGREITTLAEAREMLDLIIVSDSENIDVSALVALRSIHARLALAA